MLLKAMNPLTVLADAVGAGQTPDSPSSLLSTYFDQLVLVHVGTKTVQSFGAGLSLGFIVGIPGSDRDRRFPRRHARTGGARVRGAA